MRCFKPLIIILLALLVHGCSTIHFENGTPVPDPLLPQEESEVTNDEVQDEDITAIDDGTSETENGADQDQGFDWSFGLSSLFADDEEEVHELTADDLDPASSVRYSRWYHQAVFAMAEVSNALELNVECAGLEWNQVTTEVTFWDAAAGLADNLLLWPASSAALDLWRPMTIEYSCRTSN